MREPRPYKVKNTKPQPRSQGEAGGQKLRRLSRRANALKEELQQISPEPRKVGSPACVGPRPNKERNIKPQPRKMRRAREGQETSAIEMVPALPPLSAGSGIPRPRKNFEKIEKRGLTTEEESAIIIRLSGGGQNATDSRVEKLF